MCGFSLACTPRMPVYFIACRASKSGSCSLRSCSLLSASVNIVATRTLATPLLDPLTSPADLRGLDERLLPQLADELRAETINAVAVTGGHLGAGLGVVELTV